MFIKIHKAYRDVIAICDSNLIGKKFEENKFQLDVKENFFRGEKTSEKDLIKMMKGMSEEDSTFNIIGEKSVNTAIKAGIISAEGIKKFREFLLH